MRTIRFLLFALLLSVLLSGCAEIFEFNLFSSFDRITLPDTKMLENMSETEALDYLTEELSSPVFVEALSGDASALADVEAYLLAAMADPSTPNGKRAAILYADLQLKVYGGEDMVNNTVSLLLGDMQDVDFSSAADAETFLQHHMEGLVPPEALASRKAFDQMLDGFQAAWTAYDAFAANVDGVPESGDVPESINMGDVAQKALFAFVINEALLFYGGDSQSLWDMANGELPSEPNSGSFADPFDETGSVNKILDEAGISFS